MSRFAPRRLSSVLLVSTALPIILAICFMVYYVHHTSHMMAYDLEREAMNNAADAISNNIAWFIADAQNVAWTLADQEVIEQALQGAPVPAQKQFQNFLAHHEGYWGVSVFDPQGTIIAGADREHARLAGDTFANQEGLAAIAAGKPLAVGNAVRPLQGNDGPMVLDVAVPVKGPDGTVLGGLAVQPRWDLLMRDIVDPVRFAGFGYPVVSNAKGVFMAHPMDKDVLFKDLSGLDFVKKALAMESGQVEYDWKGKKKFMVVRTVPELGWKVQATAYISDLTATATSQATVLLCIGVAAILLVVLIVYLLLRNLVRRPIDSMVTFSQQIQKGDFTASLDDRFRFELAELGVNLREMVSQLKQRLGFSQGILDGMTVACIVTDTQGKVTFVNQPAHDILEHSGDLSKHIGQGVSTFIHGTEGRETLSVEAMKRGTALTGVQIDLNTRKGNVRNVQADVSLLKDLDGKLIGSFALFVDLTEVKEQQRLIQRKNEIIEEGVAKAAEISDQVASAAEELSAQLEQSKEGSESQKRRSAEAATAIEEMNASVLEVARNSSGAAELADQARTRAQEGASVVDKVVANISAIRDQAEDLQNDMTELGNHSQEIGRVVEVINDIADQTNLLALNAAIEAARAGEAGRGFAVVADEVRKLAEKTMSATDEVIKAIHAIQQSAQKNIDSTKQTVESIEMSTSLAVESGKALSEIVSLVEQTADQVRSIATASEQQSAAGEQINRSAEEISRIAEEAAGSIAESNQAISDLARLAQELNSTMDEMRRES